MILNWPGTFTRQSAPQVAGPYGYVPSAPNAYTNWITPGAAERFFRLRAPAGP
ncbi:MAG TPA: hypothetical protein VNT26_06475 [Candidatus Sulfotelmatobacter sp.]|nr:hypothetical protein [Candidatus Sulfotelmatobacter sp.]HWI56585.1 hypothetical protein [Bacillota bacterium]